MKNLMFLLSMITSIATLHAEGKPADEKAIRQVVQTMQDAWNAKSGEQFASVFAEGHDYIVWTGMYMPGTPVVANARAHQGIFDTQYKNSDMEIRVDKIRFIREDIATAHFLAAAYEHGTPVPEHPSVIVSILLEKQEGAWKIIAFHNCDIELSFEPGAQNPSPVPLNVMYASWYNGAGEAEK
jgi:uncharacterized protein (TIGR02246 family)